MSEIKRIDIKEFREKGFLQEVNRQFFHPLGLALEVIINEDGSEKLGGVWDYRDDPVGVMFGHGAIDIDKMRYVNGLAVSKAECRVKEFGDIIQQPDSQEDNDLKEDEDCGLGYDSCDACSNTYCEYHDFYDGGNDGY